MLAWRPGAHSSHASDDWAPACDALPAGHGVGVSTAGVALKLIETFDVEIGDELSGLLLAKDDKGKSKLIELMAKSEPPPPLPDAPSVITVTGARTWQRGGCRGCRLRKTAA